MSRLVPLLALVAAACTSDIGWQGGTGVGNPGSTKLTLARGHDLTITAASGFVEELVATRCEGEPGRVAVGAPVDLLAGAGPFAVPGGWWCALQVRFDPPLELRAVAGDGGDPAAGTLALTLQVEVVDLAVDEVWIDGPDLIVELGHHEWLDPEDVGGLPAATEVVIGPGDPAHDDLLRKVEDGSALYGDGDGDGDIDDRSAPLGAGPEHRADHDR